MLLDNKTRSNENRYFRVFDLLSNYVETGRVDIVTGYFSASAIAKLSDEVNNAKSFRMILGDLLQTEAKDDKIINLLSDSLAVDQTLFLSVSAKKAVEFLKQEKVRIKTIQRNFCHAKTYIYKDKDPRKNFQIIGSSNLTEAGLGLKESANIELNRAETGDSPDYHELTEWFQALWKSKFALDKIELADKTKIDCKEHLINLIQNFYKEYSPEDLYYKVLYELFKEDLLSISFDREFIKEISHLKDTIIYNRLYSFQQKGVISLIKMLQKENGAILADAVGLGKTWSALAVMKYFGIKGYKVILLCPKKLENNWRQYLEGHRSIFENDRLKYAIRFHTDLQDERLQNHQDGFTIKRFFQGNPKVLIVIDESHNLRNDKSSRYNFLADNILRKNKDVKVLQLSATPINNRLTDIRNQFKLIKKGFDEGFRESELGIKSLQNIFANAQKEYKNWQNLENRKIKDFIQILPQKFFDLTDALIVARTRKLIENEFGAMSFPAKEIPINEYINPENIGSLKTFDDILDAIKVNLTAYRPSEYITDEKPVSVLEDPRQREKFLVKMMFILLMKRLESSWFSFKNTVENILNHHENALAKVNTYIESKQSINLESDIVDEEIIEDLEQAAMDYAAAGMEEDTDLPEELSLGKKNPVLLSTITDIEHFKKHLEEDIAKFTILKENLNIYEQELIDNKKTDNKLDTLVWYIDKKRKERVNKKVLIFTVFKDTAQYLFRELIKRGYTKIAYVSGSLSETDDGYKGSKFNEILQRFAPYTKLYNERDWEYIYDKGRKQDPDNFQVQAGFEDWKEVIRKYDQDTWKKINNPIDILIATDCLSEGQNLQDCDCVVNYDIHWNPVRLIQRMGRIDRLSSPNKTVMGINFWPGKDYEDYLRLKDRVEKRMALMSIVGTEIDDKMTPEVERMTKDNPILSKQAQKMLEQLQVTWDDVETSDETLGLTDLSLEQFRQELFEMFQKNKEFFERMPNGIFTGFKALPDKQHPELPGGIIALLGYPAKPDEADTHVYKEHFLLYSNSKGYSTYSNNKEILGILRKHKYQPRYVPDDIEKGEQKAINILSARIKDWIKGQIPQKAVEEIQSLFENGVDAKKTSEEKKVEEKFKPENFDLIAWFVVTGKK
ncbi:MAG: phospholipase D-like domain-containing protein [Desulfobacteraceae bacterium]|nr:phospholipase D-like domain-containing protein [Desulfobacteraceae bacterium]